MENLFVFRLRLGIHRTTDIAWQRRTTHGIQARNELLVVIVRQEAEGTSAAGSIIYHFSNDSGVFLKRQFITDTNLSRRFYLHIPIAVLVIQLTEQEYLNKRIGLLLTTPETSRKDLGIVENEQIALIKILYQFRHGFVLNIPCLAMEHHQTGVIAIGRRELSNQFFWQFKFKLAQSYIIRFVHILFRSIALKSVQSSSSLPPVCRQLSFGARLSSKPRSAVVRRCPVQEPGYTFLSSTRRG